MGKRWVPLSILALLAGLLGLGAAPARATIPLTILANGGFELGSGDAPESWARDALDQSATLTWDAGEALVGRRSVKITALSPNDARWISTVAVRPHTRYALSGWIKTDGVTHSIQSVDAGANLCIMGTWERTAPVLGTSDWTYVSMTFNSGDKSEVIIGARLGYWSGMTSGTAWFDGLRLTPLDGGGPVPAWKILVLIYDSTDLTYVDADGVTRHVIAHISAEERARAGREATAFIAQDIPALTSGIMRPTATIRYPNHPLTQLSPIGQGWWPSPEDTAADRDAGFDSVIVIWDPRTTDQRTGQPIWIGTAAGLTPDTGTGQTYEAQIIESTGYGHRNVFKHEWGHSILNYFNAAGVVPLPTVTNHAAEGQYVHCPTGAAYVWADETEANPIENSIFHNNSGFTHDYYSGTVATADQPTRCLGITPAAWATGGPASHPGYYPYYHQADLAPAAATLSGEPGAAVRHILTITNTGNLTDTFTLAVEGATWEVEAPASVGPLAAGEAAQAVVTIHLPPGVWGDARDAATLALASTGDPSQVTRASITTVAARRYGLSLGPSTSVQTGEPGATVSHTLTLSNTGNITDSFRMLLANLNWPVQAPVALPDLRPGASITFTLQVTIPKGAAPGDSSLLMVTVASKGGRLTATVFVSTRVPAQAARPIVRLPLVAR